MSRILIRSHKSPFSVVDAETTLANNSIGNNTGNLVFSQAVYRLLSTADHDLQVSGLANSKPRSISARFDHVVIPLANAFRPAFVDTLHALAGLIEQLTVPVTVVGVGAQASLEGAAKGGDKVGAATKRFVTAVLDRSPSIGVRGEFTRQYLAGLGFGDEHVKVIGCPSMFMYGPELRIHRKVDELARDSRIAFNVSPYVKEMGAISQQVAADYPNLVYMAQNIQTLELMLEGTYPGKKAGMIRAGSPVTLEHPLIRENRVRFFLDPRTWFDHLGTYDFSFGTRIHGNIAALLGGTPAVLLAHDSRTLELAEYHAIPHRLITEVAGDADPIRLHAEADWEPLNAAQPARWETFAAFLAEHRLSTVYDEGNDASSFDEPYAAAEFPPPVETLMGLSPEQLYEMKRTISELGDELRSAFTELTGTTRGGRPARRGVRRLPARVWNKIGRTVRGLG